LIVYSSSKDGFLADARANSIHTRIHSEFERKLQRRVGKSELDSWRNSMQFMSNVLADDQIPGDAGVAIEFMIPLSSKRIDFILSGRNEAQRDVAVIIELKQWSQVFATSKDAVVRTFLGGREVEVAHPSYQAWTYAALVQDYNETVRKDDIGLLPCAYLHNLDADEAIHDSRYAGHLAKAPSFIARDAEKLAAFLGRHVRYGDSGNVMYRIEHGRIRPSKALADCLVGMLQGNSEFVMIDDQKLVFETAVDLAHRAQNGHRQVLVVEGGPGTGKSVVAINLLVELTRRDLVAQYISRNAAPRAVFSARLSGTVKQTRINNLFRGSGSHTETADKTFDALIVDEAHRLNEKSGLYANLGENQVKELIGASKLSVFFLDEDQKVTLKDIGGVAEIEKWAMHHGADVHRMNLASQFRCSGSDGYVAFLDSALQVRETANRNISEDEYDFRVFDNPAALHNAIRDRNKLSNKARMVAGYCWDWVSKRSASAMDISFPEYGYAARWNLSSDGSLWIIADKSVDEVGCIHTCQGLEVDYVGVIIGPDLIVRDGEIQTIPEKRSRMDSSIKGYKKFLASNPIAARSAADRIIKNTYKTLMTRGQKGCFIFCSDRETRDYFRSLIAAPAPMQVVSAGRRFEGLKLRLLELHEVRAFRNSVPIFDLDMAAGAFSSEQLPSSESWVELPAHIRPREGMFVARVIGESMNKRIPSGAWCLFSANPGGTRNGKIVVVSHRSISDPDSGESYTIKRYFSEKSESADGDIGYVRIVLRPESHDPSYQSILLSEENGFDLKVVGEFITVLD
jgi:DUF2075 family protein/SOS-response transcriptional repressor LexA